MFTIPSSSIANSVINGHEFLRETGMDCLEKKKKKEEEAIQSLSNFNRKANVEPCL
jgi:hypothetical protein